MISYSNSYTELQLQMRPIINCLLVVIGSSNVEPVAGVRLNMYFLVVGKHAQNKLIEAERKVTRDQGNHLAAEAVNPHADQVRYLGLLFECVKEIIRIGFQNPEIDNL